MDTIKLKHNGMIVLLSSNWFYPYRYGTECESKDNVILCDSHLEIKGDMVLIESIIPKYYSFAENSENILATSHRRQKDLHAECNIAYFFQPE